MRNPPKNHKGEVMKSKTYDQKSMKIRPANKSQEVRRRKSK